MSCFHMFSKHQPTIGFSERPGNNLPWREHGTSSPRIRSNIYLLVTKNAKNNVSWFMICHSSYHPSLMALNHGSKPLCCSVFCAILALSQNNKPGQVDLREKNKLVVFGCIWWMNPWIFQRPSRIQWRLCGINGACHDDMALRPPPSTRCRFPPPCQRQSRGRGPDQLTQARVRTCSSNFVKWDHFPKKFGAQKSSLKLETTTVLSCKILLYIPIN